MSKILVIHGPNLNLLGKREPDIYGRITLNKINSELKKYARSKRVSIKINQSNHEGEIVSLIGDASKSFDVIVINPAAYTHTSVAIRDVISATTTPVIEVHLSNIYSREEFRHKSLISAVVYGGIYGFGQESYLLALQAAITISGKKHKKKK